MVKQVLWICPKCHKQFKRKNQSHYCKEKPQTIEAYILQQEKTIQPDLIRIHKILSSSLPKAEKRMTWSIPTYWETHNILHFCANKNDIGFYPGKEAVDYFANRLLNYKTDKGTIHIEYGKIDDQLIEDIAKWCWATRNS